MYNELKTDTDEVDGKQLTSPVLIVTCIVLLLAGVGVAYGDESIQGSTIVPVEEDILAIEAGEIINRSNCFGSDQIHEEPVVHMVHDDGEYPYEIHEDEYGRVIYTRESLPFGYESRTSYEWHDHCHESSIGAFPVIKTEISEYVKGGDILSTREIRYTEEGEVISSTKESVAGFLSEGIVKIMASIIQ